MLENEGRAVSLCFQQDCIIVYLNERNSTIHQVVNINHKKIEISSWYANWYFTLEPIYYTVNLKYFV